MTVNLKINESEGYNGARSVQGVLDTIDFSDWYFYPAQSEELAHVLEKVFRATMAEAIQNVLQDDPPDIDFRSDGASINVSINLGSNWNDGRIFFTASIMEMIDDYIKVTDPDTMDGGDEARIELAKCLRACVAKLEAAMGAEESS